MPNLDQELTEAALKESAEEAQATAAILTAKAMEDSAIYGRLDDLIRNPDMAWFLETFIVPLVTAEHDGALNVKLDAAARSDHAQRHDIALKIAGLLAERHRHFQHQIEGRMRAQEKGLTE